MEKESLIKLKNIYSRIQHEIRIRLVQFRHVWELGDDHKIFEELIFCLLTPQSKAKVCWQAVENLVENELLFTGNKDQIANGLIGVRFKNIKAANIVKARKMFYCKRKLSIINKLKEFKNPFEIREWLVESVRGMGYKESSHFIRNIGLGEDLAILDRHILKNLARLEIIDAVPRSISKKKYLEIEDKMRDLSKKIEIPLEHLDLLLWYKETGEVFK